MCFQITLWRHTPPSGFSFQISGRGRVNKKLQGGLVPGGGLTSSVLCPPTPIPPQMKTLPFCCETIILRHNPPFVLWDETMKAHSTHVMSNSISKAHFTPWVARSYYGGESSPCVVKSYSTPTTPNVLWDHTIMAHSSPIVVRSHFEGILWPMCC